MNLAYPCNMYIFRIKGKNGEPDMRVTDLLTSRLADPHPDTMEIVDEGVLIRKSVQERSRRGRNTVVSKETLDAARKALRRMGWGSSSGT